MKPSWSERIQRVVTLLYDLPPPSFLGAKGEKDTNPRSCKNAKLRTSIAASTVPVADATRAWKIDTTDEEISNLLSSRRRCCLSLLRLIHFPSGSAHRDDGRRGTRSRAAEDIKLPTFDRISDCAGLEFRAGLNGIPFAIRSYSVGRPGCGYISRLFRLRLIRLRGKISIRRFGCTRIPARVRVRVKVYTYEP